MKKVSALFVILLGMSFVAAPAHATGHGGHGGGWFCSYFPNVCAKFQKKKWKKKLYKKYKHNYYKKHKKHSVPEIDAAGAAIALAMLAGVVSIGRERRKAAKK